MTKRVARLDGYTAKRMFGDVKRMQREKMHKLIKLVMIEGVALTAPQKELFLEYIKQDNFLLEILELLSDGEYHEAEEILNTKLLNIKESAS